MDSSRSFWLQNCQPGHKGMFASVMILGIIISLTLLSWAAFGPTKNHHSLQQVAIIFRHGDRTPTETYPNDPYQEAQWEEGWGALTKRGMLKLYKLGTWIRKEYNSIISKKFLSSETKIISSYADRCIMSAQALLAGLYPPRDEDKFIDILPWRPVPVHSIPRELDKLITVKYPCPALDVALKKAYMNESITSDKYLASYYAGLTFHTGKKIATINDIGLLYTTLEIEEKNNLKLPEWTKEFYNETMREIAARSTGIFTSNTLQRRLHGGPLLKEITDNMMRSHAGQDKKKLYLYSAHDITLVSVLRAMGFTNEYFLPNYGAALIFELNATKDPQPEFVVNVKYLNNTETNEPYILKIPGCKEPCKFSDLLQVWRDVLPTDWDAECHA